MRRARRGGHAGLEFGGSGEDSFVAVVVTKLTGALLFILLLTMVIMALLPKAIDSSRSQLKTDPPRTPLAISTPEELPDAISGRPYAIALAATGGDGPLTWSVDGELPAGLVFVPGSGQLKGTPKAGTPKPVEFVIRVSDGERHVARMARLAVLQPDHPLAIPAAWKPHIPPVPWRAWVEQGFGFLVLLLVHLVGMNALGGAERWAGGGAIDTNRRRRFFTYRLMVRGATLVGMVALVVWLLRTRA
jgi:hypothetical protein